MMKGRWGAKQDRVLEGFDFKKALAMMHAINWTWFGKKRVTEEGLKALARQHLTALVNDKKITAIYSGGLRASRHKDELGQEVFCLEFIGERSESN